MNTLDVILHSDLAKILSGLAVGCSGTLALIMLAFLMLHIAHYFGKKTFIYNKKQPEPGWDKKFYPACTTLVIGLIVLTCIIAYWRNNNWQG